MDASSTYQDSLPVTSDQLLQQLDEQGLSYTRIDHIPLRTVADSKQVRDGFLSAAEGGGHIKNLYLRCLLYTSPSPRDRSLSRMPSSA